jgi:hypothetical protein
MNGLDMEVNMMRRGIVGGICVHILIWNERRPDLLVLLVIEITALDATAQILYIDCSYATNIINSLVRKDKNDHCYGLSRIPYMSDVEYHAALAKEAMKDAAKAKREAAKAEREAAKAKVEAAKKTAPTAAELTMAVCAAKEAATAE